MKSREEISKKVEETLELIERVGKVEPKPFFYTRLTARIDRLNEKSFVHQKVFKLQHAFIALMLLLAINGFSIYKLLPLRVDTQVPTLETFIENYQLDVKNIYTLNENDL